MFESDKELVVSRYSAPPSNKLPIACPRIRGRKKRAKEGTRVLRFNVHVLARFKHLQTPAVSTTSFLLRPWSSFHVSSSAETSLRIIRRHRPNVLFAATCPNKAGIDFASSCLARKSRAHTKPAQPDQRERTTSIIRALLSRSTFHTALAACRLRKEWVVTRRNYRAYGQREPKLRGPKLKGGWTFRGYYFSIPAIWQPTGMRFYRASNSRKLRFFNSMDYVALVGSSCLVSKVS